MKRICMTSPFVLLLGFVILATGCSDESQRTRTPSTAGDAHEATAQKQAAGSSRPLPQLVDLGAHKCVPCKMMAPILDELAEEYDGRMVIEFIDVWKNPQAGHKYGIRMIPTQIFYGSDGKELFRHEGFYSKADILSKWKELGYDFAETPKNGD